MDVKNHSVDMKTDKQVKFCLERVCSDKCEMCDKTFSKNIPLPTTAFHQIGKDFKVFFSGNSNEMITDIGCPNSVIGCKDENHLKTNLSKFQQENLEVKEVNEHFKFGPSGPYKGTKKLWFPIMHGSKVLWAEVSIVDARIPMLLGNNILKPLGAEIKLFASGNGILKINEKEIKLTETEGGHYTLKITDLGKLWDKTSTGSSFVSKASSYFECDECGNSQKTMESLKEHKQRRHEEEKALKSKCETCGNTFYDVDCFKYHKRETHCTVEVRHMKPILKKAKVFKDISEEENNVNIIVTDVNTQLNASSSKSDKKILLSIKKLALLKDEFRDKSGSCEKDSIGETNVKSHKIPDHEQAFHLKETAQVFLSHHEEDTDEMQFEMNETVWDVLLSEDEGKELTKMEKEEVLKLHRYFAHRNGRKLWENLFQPAGRMKGKKKLVLQFLEHCEVCKKYKRTPPRPKVGLPKAKDVNEVVSIDLKIIKKTGNKEIGILYLHDEFSKLIKGQVINDKNRDTIIKGIENKWIIGDGAGPGHPSKGFFSDNGGEFLNDDLIHFAAALNISIKMTAASSPWMNGSCERNHATVDRIIEKLQEDDPKISLQKAVNIACFAKNTEINKTGYSPLQLFCGKSPGFPGLSDCNPSNIEMDGNNEYLKVLRRLDLARTTARQVDCNQRIKTALKSKINTSCEKTYSYGDTIWFKLDSSHKWKSGTVLGQDGKVLFVKYANFIRRVPLDRIIPAEESHDASDEEPDQQDVDNKERLQDDDFENVEIVTKKDKEIDALKKANQEQIKQITELKDKVFSYSNQNISPPKPALKILPKLYQRIRFQMAGENNEKLVEGKVIKKNKPSSVRKNVVGIKLDDGLEKHYDFSIDIDNWSDINEPEAAIEPCCLYSFTEEKNIQHETFATVLTKAEIKGRPDVDKVMNDEIKKV